MKQCGTCHATYADSQRDGTRYFHACAPLSDAEVIAALGLNVDPAKWTPLERQTFAAASRVRPNARDENAPPVAALKAAIDAVPTGDAGAFWLTVNRLRATAIVSAGGGVTDVPDVVVAQSAEALGK